VEVFLKSEERKVDPRKPDTHPGYLSALMAARVHKQEMHFENDAEQRDYDRAIKSNPNNIPGLPPFYPPEKIPAISGIDIRPQRKFFAWGKWREIPIRERFTEDDLRVLSGHDINLFCSMCGKVTSHAINKKGSFCHKCGHVLPLHC